MNTEQNNQPIVETPITESATTQIPIAETPEPATMAKVVAKKTTRSNTPQDDINLAAVALRVAQNLVNYPQITLIMYNQADFLASATQFHALVQQRVIEQQSRPTLTRTTRQLQADIKTGIKVIKGYLFEKYKDDAKAISYYADFGFEKKGKTWTYPTDQQHILSAFNTTKAAILTHGFDTKSFGTAYWTALATNYAASVQSAVSSDGTSSTTVFQKETLKKELKAIMVALRGVVRANYGAGANAILRDLGFQKEKV